MRPLYLFVLLLLCAGWGKPTELQKGKDFFKAGAFSNAIEMFSKAIQTEPENPEPYFFRGAAFSAMDLHGEAVKDYSKAIEMNPQYADAYWSRGYSYANRNMEDRAVEDYTKALELNPKDKAMVYELRSGSYYRQGKLKEAEKDLQEVLHLKPNDQQALEGLDQIHEAQENPDFNPYRLDARPIEQQPLFGEGALPDHVKEANQQFVDAVMKEFRSREAAADNTLKLAWEYYRQEEFSVAMKRFNQAWLLDPKNPEIYHGFALILREWNFNREADNWDKIAVERGYKPKQPIQAVLPAAKAAAPVKPAKV